jgi:hypothetical protein
LLQQHFNYNTKDLSGIHGEIGREKKRERKERETEIEIKTEREELFHQLSVLSLDHYLRSS